MAKTEKTTSGKGVSSARVAAKLRAKELGRFSLGVLFLAKELPERLSMAQMAFFMIAATADLSGRPTTYSAIKEAMETRGDSIKSTYKIFLEPSRTFPSGLGWLTQSVDADDRRIRNLHLSDKGLRVISELLDAIEM